MFYPQMPIEGITEVTYNEMVGKIKEGEIKDNSILPPFKIFICEVMIYTTIT